MPPTFRTATVPIPDGATVSRVHWHLDDETFGRVVPEHALKWGQDRLRTAHFEVDGVQVVAYNTTAANVVEVDVRA